MGNGAATSPVMFSLAWLSTTISQSRKVHECSFLVPVFQVHHRRQVLGYKRGQTRRVQHVLAAGGSSRWIKTGAKSACLRNDSMVSRKCFATWRWSLQRTASLKPIDRHYGWTSGNLFREIAGKLKGEGSHFTSIKHMHRTVQPLESASCRYPVGPQEPRQLPFGQSFGCVSPRRQELVAQGQEPTIAGTEWQTLELRGLPDFEALITQAFPDASGKYTKFLQTQGHCLDRNKIVVRDPANIRGRDLAATGLQDPVEPAT